MFQNILFQTPSIIFGMDVLSQLGKEAVKLGAGRALLVTGPGSRKRAFSTGRHPF